MRTKKGQPINQPNNQSTNRTTNQSQLTYFAPALNSTSGILDEDEGKEVVKTYKATMSKLREFESKHVALLGADVEATSLKKLKQTLSKLDEEPDEENKGEASKPADVSDEKERE